MIAAAMLRSKDRALELCLVGGAMFGTTWSNGLPPPPGPRVGDGLDEVGENEEDFEDDGDGVNVDFGGG